MTKSMINIWNKIVQNLECINPKLNGNKPILQMAITERGITQIGIVNINFTVIHYEGFKSYFIT